MAVRSRSVLNLSAWKMLIFAHGHVEQVARRDALRVVVVVALVGSRNIDEIRGELVGRANRGQRSGRRSLHSIARESRLKLFVRRQGERCIVGCRAGSRCWCPPLRCRAHRPPLWLYCFRRGCSGGAPRWEHMDRWRRSRASIRLPDPSIAPVKAPPETVSPTAIAGQRVLKVRVSVEFLVMVDAEGNRRSLEQHHWWLRRRPLAAGKTGRPPKR